MIVLVGLIYGIIYGIKIWISCEIILSIAIVLLCACVGAIIGAGISIVIGLIPKIEYDQISKQELIALKDNISINGSFFLGSGNIDGKLKYYFYIKTKSGGFKAQNIEADNVEIFENNKTPCIIKYESKFKNIIWNWIAFTIKEKAEINIPKGSILRNYKLNLK
jgi:hypothetical protein